MTSRQSERLARLLPDGMPRWVRCYDNGGESLDRYTVVYTGNYTGKTAGEHLYLAMNAAPFRPQGIGQHGGHNQPIDALDGKRPPAIGRKCHLGKRIRFQDLPADCQRAVMQDYLYLWDLPGGERK